MAWQPFSPNQNILQFCWFHLWNIYEITITSYPLCFLIHCFRHCSILFIISLKELKSSLVASLHRDFLSFQSLGISAVYIAPSHPEQGWSLLPVGHCGNGSVWLLRLVWALPSGLLILGETRCHVVRILKQPYSEPTRWGTQTSCQKQALTYLRSRSFTLNSLLELQATSWLKPPQRPWVRTTNLSHTQIPYSQELGK